MPPRRALAASLVVAFTTALVARGLVGAPSRAETTVDVVVVRADGSPAPGLKAQDFVVVAGGKELVPASVAETERPACFFFVIDVSLSSTWKMFAPVPGPARPLEPPLRRLEAIIGKSFIRTLRAGDRGRVGVLSRELVSTPDRTDPAALSRDVHELVNGIAPEDRTGPSPLWDGVNQAASQMDVGCSRRTVIFVSDGQATESSLTAADAARKSAARGVPISVISLGFDLDVPQADRTFVPLRPNGDLRQLADQTGGLFLFQGRVAAYKFGSGLSTDTDRVRLNNDRWPDPGAAIEHVTHAYQRAYTLVLSSDSAGDVSEVRVRGRGFQVRLMGAR